jgi:hypothetical protein
MLIVLCEEEADRRDDRVFSVNIRLLSFRLPLEELSAVALGLELAVALELTLAAVGSVLAVLAVGSVLAVSAVLAVGSVLAVLAVGSVLAVVAVGSVLAVAAA